MVRLDLMSIDNHHKLHVDVRMLGWVGPSIGYFGIGRLVGLNYWFFFDVAKVLGLLHLSLPFRHCATFVEPLILCFLA
jgi:hypothetical protein